MKQEFLGSNRNPITDSSAFDSKTGAKLRFAKPLPLIMVSAAVLRLAAALAVQYVSQRKGTLCLFGDTPIYWLYGKAIALGTPYVVHQWDVPHYALRTPGYPLWLAANMKLFGEAVLGVRIAQAVLGVLMVWWIYRLAKAVGCSERSALWSAAIVAIDPFQVGLSALILSESLFTPMLVLFVLCMIQGLKKLERTHLSVVEHADFFAVGALQAFLGLVRPSWLAYLPFLFGLFVWYATKRHGARKAVLVTSAIVFGWAVVTAPWAIRNDRRIDRFAIGGTWGGATLYDSVRPGASGASEMSFVADPQFRDLPETVQDDLWKRLSMDAIKSEPGRMMNLAVEKQRRFWSPWPNDSAKLPLAGKLLSAALVLPVWAAMGWGWFRKRGSGWVYVVISPLVVTALTHLLFVGSSRYRMAVIVPAMILAGEGVETAMKSITERKRKRSSVQDEMV